ncbi:MULTISPECIES: MFS transporter [unclassified Leifsonia]|uniref:MFS transporter n=1 Tax=unclassified Leifsonia TaxID=2663824 RepID=UPI0008A78115|nr:MULTISPECIES: MFS transporter [unclassified Leifsonia]SEH65390.1 Major Facilitator Superfamily protein [Leifsonia sp. CL154]SFL27258.1 Major Facilitator Superfamily protein [Leifsonia sp. CL147]
MTMSPDVPAVTTPDSQLPTRVSAPAGRALMPFLGIINFAIVSAGLGFSAVLLPNQLTLLDADNKVSNLALVTSVSILSAVIVQPLVGALSDRTRSRWGRRLPWMLAGGLLMAAAFCGIGLLQSVALIVLLACVVQAGSATISAPLAALIADRYEIDRRGMASAFIGFGLNLGYAAGVIVASMLAFNLPLAYVAFGAGLTVLLIAFVLVARDRPNKDMAVEPFSLGSFLRSFWINPVKNPAFAWAFVARFLFILAFFIFQTYLFFIISDYLKLSLADTNSLIGLTGLASIVPAIIAGYITGALSDKLGRRKIFLYIASALAVAGYVVLIASPTVPALFLMTVFMGLGFGMYLASDSVVMTQVLPNLEGSAAKDLGILNLATLIGQSVAAIVAASAINLLGGYISMFFVAIGIAVLGALAVIPIRGVR